MHRNTWIQKHDLPQSTHSRILSTWKPSQCCPFRFPCSRCSSSANGEPWLKLCAFVLVVQWRLFRGVKFNSNLAAKVIAHSFLSLLRPLVPHKRLSCNQKMVFYKLECYEEYFLSLSSSVNLDQIRKSVYRRNPDLRPSPWSSEIKQIEILFQSNNSFILYFTLLYIYKKK